MKKQDQRSLDVVYLSTLLHVILDIVTDPLGIDMTKVDIIKDFYEKWIYTTDNIEEYVQVADQQVENDPRINALRAALSLYNFNLNMYSDDVVTPQNGENNEC